MKKFSVFFIFIVSFLYVNSQTQVPNGNFENWLTVSTANDSLEGWTNAIYYDLGYPLGVVRIATAEQESSDVFQGNYSVKMETKDLYGNTVPGMMQLGQFNLTNDDMEISGGYPFADRPIGISFYAKYTPAGSDSAYMYAYMTKYDEANNSTDTIAMTAYFFTDTIVDYTQILMPFAYMSEEIPDTINILFISTNPLDMKVGSTLWVDSLQMKYDIDAYPTLAIAATEITDTSFTANWFPSMYSNEYYLDVASDSIFLNLITGYDNLLVTSYSPTVYIPEPEQGAENYFYRVRVKYGDTATSVNSNVIPVNLAYPTVCLPASEISSGSFRANWLSKDNAESYNLQVSNNAEFTDFVSGYENLNLIDTTTVVSGLQPNSDYYYRVQVVYGYGLSPFSNVINQATVRINTVENFSSYYVKNNILYLNNVPANSEITIYDASGKIFFNEHISSENSEILIPQNGVYIGIIKNSNKSFRFKFSL